MYTGYGVVATKRFTKGDFLLDYFGDLKFAKDMDGVEITYLFHFRYAERHYWYVA